MPEPLDYQQALQQLRDIHLPQAIDSFPATAGWYLIGLLVLFGSLLWLVYYWRWRPLKKQLTLIANLTPPEQPRALIELLKVYSIGYQPESARLSGQAWLNWLEKTLQEPFSESWREWIHYGCLSHQPAPADWFACYWRWLKQLPNQTQPSSFNQRIRRLLHR